MHKKSRNMKKKLSSSFMVTINPNWSSKVMGKGLVI
jgi:hypothetical protein